MAYREKRCFYCKCRLSRKNRTTDHLQPLSRGGSDKSWNKVSACRRCNTEKGCLTLEEYRVVIAYRKGLFKPFDFDFPGEVLDRELFST